MSLPLDSVKLNQFEYTQQAHGGDLKPLLASTERSLALKQEAIDLTAHALTQKQLCDLELLLNGGFSPLNGFLNEGDYLSVINSIRLTDGTLWPIPISLDVDESFAESLQLGQKIRLDDSEGVALAVLTLESIYRVDKEKEAELVFGTQDSAHPGVAELYRAGDYYLGGSIEGIQLPEYYDFSELRKTPTQLRQEFADNGWNKVVAFQTRNPMHRAHKELTVRAANDLDVKLLVHPVVGKTKPGDIDHYTRVKCYKHIMQHYPEGLADLSLLPLAMRMAGPKEALWHAIIRKNYGCTHLIVGRDHAGPGKDSLGNDFYGPYEAQELLVQHQQELGIKMVPFQMLVYLANRKGYFTLDEILDKDEVKNISGTELRHLLQQGHSIPEWFSYPEVIAELRKRVPSLPQRGLTLFFTGLSGAGKSTIAKIVQSRLMEITDRAVTLLDGDEVRKTLSEGLGFSKTDRDANVFRIGYVAAEISRHRGIAICAPIAPYAELRKKVRGLVEQSGTFVEVHVSTPLEICEKRDRKGLYAKARRGEIKAFTGISDPYQTPQSPELTIDTGEYSAVESAQLVINYLYEKGILEVSEQPIVEVA